MQASDEDEDPLDACKRLSRYSLARTCWRGVGNAPCYSMKPATRCRKAEIDLPLFMATRDSGVNKAWLNGSWFSDPATP